MYSLPSYMFQYRRLYIDNVNNNNDGNNDTYKDTDYDSNDIDTNYDA